MGFARPARSDYYRAVRGMAVQTEIVWLGAAGALLLGYGLGSIPFGLLLTRLAGAGRPAQHRFGHIGATNVLRTGRKGLAAATLVSRCRNGRGGGADRRRAVPGHRDARRARRLPRPLLPRVAAVSRRARAWPTLMGVCSRCIGPAGLVYAAVWLALLAAAAHLVARGDDRLDERAGQRRSFRPIGPRAAAARAGADRGVEAIAPISTGC